MNTQVELILRIIGKEVWAKWRIVTVLYVIASFSFLAAAWYWPRVYTSSSVAVIDPETILSPLMRGTAVATEVGNYSRQASQIILSKRSLRKVLESPTWNKESGEKYTAKEVEFMTESIKNRTSVTNAGTNLIEISYRDLDPQKAFVTTKMLTDIFIEDSALVKQDESRSAYEFIDNQVSIYHQKLKNAEEAIKHFRSNNIDASPDAKDNANNRFIELKRELEGVELEMATEESVLDGYKRQLAGERGAENNASIVKESQLNERIAALELRLDDLRLNYRETYPDIVQIKGQIESLNGQISTEVIKRKEAELSGRKEIPTGALAQTLRSQILATETRIAGLKSRANQLQRLAERERGTLSSINEVEAEISELTRDYTVNQNMYQELLGQRENARISMNIDIENQGSTIKIQEPAYLPLTPKGIRFAHIVLAGLVVSFMIPVGAVFGLTLVDQKVRSEMQVYEQFKLPILASVYAIDTPFEKKKKFIKVFSMAATIFMVWGGYGYVIMLRLQG